MIEVVSTPLGVVVMESDNATDICGVDTTVEDNEWIDETDSSDRRDESVKLLISGRSSCVDDRPALSRDGEGERDTGGIMVEVGITKTERNGEKKVGVEEDNMKSVVWKPFDSVTEGDGTEEVDIKPEAV